MQLATGVKLLSIMTLNCTKTSLLTKQNALQILHYLSVGTYFSQMSKFVIGPISNGNNCETSLKRDTNNTGECIIQSHNTIHSFCRKEIFNTHFIHILQKAKSHFYYNTINDSWSLKTKQNVRESCEEAPNNKRLLWFLLLK